MRRPDPEALAPAPAELAVQVGSEVASLLSAALERVNALATTGRIQRGSLAALRDEIELARRVGMAAQQYGRLAAGQVPQSPEPLDLTSMLREALRQRAREIETQGLAVCEQLRPAWVMGDPALTYALLQALLDWCFEHAFARIDVATEHSGAPQHPGERARIVCGFELPPGHAARRGADAQALETMSWRLLVQTAAALGLEIGRGGEGARSEVVIEFPHSVGAPRLALASAPGDPLRSLVGLHVLVVAQRQDLRQQVRDALRTHGLLVDFAASVDEARVFCESGLPHALVHEAALGSEGFEQLRRDLLGEAPRLAFVQIADEGTGAEARRSGGVAAVARAGVAESLPQALAAEFARGAG